MDIAGFGIICIFMGWNWFSRRSWWAEQASKSWVAIDSKLFERIFVLMGVLSIIAGLVFLGTGIVGMWTGHPVLPLLR